MGQYWTNYECYKKYDVIFGEYASACLEGPKLAIANLPGHRDMAGGYRITRHIPPPDRYYCLGMHLVSTSLVIKLSRASQPRVVSVRALVPSASLRIFGDKKEGHLWVGGTQVLSPVNLRIFRANII